MADPLSQLRQFHINGREIKEHNGYIILGEYGWPKNVNTNYQVYSTDDDKTKKEYYTLECLLYFLRNMDLAHHHYVKQAGRDSIPVVHRPDRKHILAYLKGEQQTSSGIDKNAPIPPLRLAAAEILAKADNLSAAEPQPSTSAQSSSQNSQTLETSKGGDNVAKSLAQKRPHDPEMEKKLREDFASRLNEPSNKKLATAVSTEDASRASEAMGGSAAISKFGAAKLAEMRAKHLAVKRTTIIDADAEVNKSGSGVADASNKEQDLLIAMDTDLSKLIRSKEKIWRNRASVLQAQSKNFVKTVLPFANALNKMEDPNKKAQGQMPQIPPDMQMNPFQAQQQQQSTQKNAYNRYDQERFVKLDIGVEIDTKKSFVSAATANGLPNNLNKMPDPAAALASGNMPPPRPSDTVDSRHHQAQVSRIPTVNRLKKRTSTVPIIIIPAAPTSLINMYNASDILQDLNYADGNKNRPRDSEILIQRKKQDGTHAAYKIIDNPVKLDPEDWNRVVAVFVQGPAWQFKGWPWGGSPVEIFARIRGFHLKWDEAKLDDNVAKWNVHILTLSRNKRHLDKANLMKFWSSLDNFMVKYKSFLKF